MENMQAPSFTAALYLEALTVIGAPGTPTAPPESPFNHAIPMAFGFMVFMGFLLIAAYFTWRRTAPKGSEEDKGSRSCFEPSRLVLKGEHGEVIRKRVRIDGPEGQAFTTYNEDSWWLAEPTSGMMPQDIDVVLYTQHAPLRKHHELTLRLFPAALNAAGDELRISVHLKIPRSARRLGDTRPSP